MKSLAKKEFMSEIIREYSITPNVEELGLLSNSMELFKHDNGTFGIEWDILSIDEYAYIGIWVEDGTKKIIDYDGVFSLSDQAIEFLIENGFDCDEVMN
jgi:hypothetical protein